MEGYVSQPHDRVPLTDNGEEEFNQIPAGRLKPAPPDWDPPRWAQYQHELTSGYQACMPTCCGYNDCVADRSYCTDYCLERGMPHYSIVCTTPIPSTSLFLPSLFYPAAALLFLTIFAGHVTGMAINPKTGNMAPPPRMAKRSDNSEDYIERRGKNLSDHISLERSDRFPGIGITDFPPENLLPCPPDWDRTDWDRYQGALINSFQGCMPNCCGYKRCSNYPDEVPGCQKHCMDMGMKLASLYCSLISSPTLG
jgi:hypothetical protein